VYGFPRESKKKNGYEYQSAFRNDARSTGTEPDRDIAASASGCDDMVIRRENHHPHRPGLGEKKDELEGVRKKSYQKVSSQKNENARGGAEKGKADVHQGIPLLLGSKV